MDEAEMAVDGHVSDIGIQTESGLVRLHDGNVTVPIR